MSYRLAFASSDGQTVDEHFGRAEDFHIYEINGDKATYIETRINNVNKGEECGHGKINKNIELISDCKAIFVANVGRCGVERLKIKQIEGFVMPYKISEILEKILEKKYKFFNFE